MNVEGVRRCFVRVKHRAAIGGSGWVFRCIGRVYAGFVAAVEKLLLIKAILANEENASKEDSEEGSP